MNDTKKPNVLFVLTDDQRYDTIHAIGNPYIKTPTLDNLCAEGTAFTQAHIPGGTLPAVCMSSRAMLHTGRDLFNLHDDGRSIPAEHIMMPEAFRNNGYNTFGTGKWHNGYQSYARCFSDGAEIYFGGMWDHWNVPTYDFDPTGKYEKLSTACVGAYFNKTTMRLRTNHINMGVHSTDLFTDKALQWLEQYDSDAPFFMNIAYMAPHDPRTMPEPFSSMYNPEDMPLECFCGEHFRYGIEDIRDEKLAKCPRVGKEIQQHIADYFGMISHLDDRLGKIIDMLKKKGVYDNTIIVFTSDNGIAVGRHGLMGKQSCYEHSVRIPLVICGPGIPKGQRNEGYHYLHDIFPTLCKLCDIPIPDSCEGTDFSEAFSDHNSGRESIYSSYGDKVRSYKDKRYKLIEYRFQDVVETQLFDLALDPLETCNKAHDPSYNDIEKDLRERMIAHYEASNEKDHPLGKLFWQRFNKDPDFVEPKAESWINNLFKP